MPTLRPDLEKAAVALELRHQAFRQALCPVSTGSDEAVGAAWRVGCSGAYFAFVRHPFPGVSAEYVCSRLAGKIGVVVRYVFVTLLFDLCHELNSTRTDVTRSFFCTCRKYRLGQMDPSVRSQRR